MRDVAIFVCDNWCVVFVISVKLQAASLNFRYDLTISDQSLIQ